MPDLRKVNIRGSIWQKRYRLRTTAPCNVSCATNVTPAKLIPMKSDRSGTMAHGTQRVEIPYIARVITPT